MTHAIHCLNNISAKGTDLLTADYALTDAIDEAEGILVRSAAMHDMAFSPNLLAIGRAGAGTNNIPVDRCAEEGIVVFNTPGANANAVKELVLAGLLLGARDIIGGTQWVRDNAGDPEVGKAAEKAKKAFAGGEIAGKTLGVIGLGAIGKLVARAADALGMSVVGYDPFVTPEAAAEILAPMTFTTDLDEVLAAGDYLTIHVPAMDSTKGMINADAIAKMRDGVVFLNFSRDVLVDDAAMAAALESGKVARYITDFANPAVVAMPRAIVIPHLGASTAEAEENCAIMATQELMAFIERGAIRNSVNYPAIDAGEAVAGRLVVLHAQDACEAVAALGTVAAQSAGRGNAVTLLDGADATAVAATPGVRRVRAL